MKTTDQANVRFLRRILFALIFATIATGGVATYSSVKASQPNFILPILAAK